MGRGQPFASPVVVHLQADDGEDGEEGVGAGEEDDQTLHPPVQAPASFLQLRGWATMPSSSHDTKMRDSHQAETRERMADYLWSWGCE